MLWRFGAFALLRFGALADWRFGALALWRVGALALWRFGALALAPAISNKCPENQLTSFAKDAPPKTYFFSVTGLSLSVSKQNN